MADPTGTWVIDAHSVTMSDGAVVHVPATSIPLSYTPSGSPPPPPPSGSLTTPSGYTSGQLIWNEPFTSLDNSKWNTYIADSNGVWDGHVSLPNSSEDPPPGGFSLEYYNPSALAFGAGGLTVTATRSSAFSAFQWKSGAMCTQGKWAWPSGKTIYIQWLMKCPDMTTGAWPAVWHLPSGSGNELDHFEGGMIGGSIPINRCLENNWNPGQAFQDAGVNLSAGFNVYGFEYVPGVSLKTFFNGAQVSSTSNPNSGTYEIILNLQMAASNAAGWHSTVSGSTPNGLQWFIQQMQVYAK